MTAQPRISVVVPAPALGDDGRRCLTALVALGPDVEVLFIPDSQPADLPPGVRCIPSGPVAVPAKRQLGLEHSSAPIVAWMDDDAYPHATWLENVLAAFASDEQIGAVCGPTITPLDAPHLERLGGRVFASLLVSGSQRIRYSFQAARDLDESAGVNIAFRREDAVAIRFDSPYYPGDDTIVCDRLLRRGRLIRYVPQAIVFHSRRPLWGPHMRQVWPWGRQRAAFVRTVGGNSIRPGYFAPSLLVLGLGLGWALPGRGRGLWRIGTAGYLAACVAAAADRNLGDWARVSVAIPATHICYGAAFLAGLLGAPPLQLRIVVPEPAGAPAIAPAPPHSQACAA